MAKLYRSLRSLLRLGVELYYVDIQSTGRELVPDEGPLIFAANHPNSIMDTFILGTQTHRVLSYMARSGLFKNPLVGALFHRCGVIPIYRAQDGPPTAGSNEASFRAAYARLGEGGAIGIFPEGHNSAERAVQEIKTGTARIALGAERQHKWALGLKIVPVGLNFVNRDRFLSSVLIRFGEPICVAEWTEAYLRARDPEGVQDKDEADHLDLNAHLEVRASAVERKRVARLGAMTEDEEREVARALTDHLLERMRQEATHIDGDMILELTQDVYQMYGFQLLGDLAQEWQEQRKAGGVLGRLFSPGHKAQDLDDVFWVKQRIADAAAHFQRTDPAFFEEVRNRVWAYKDHLAQARMRHDFLDKRPETLSNRREAVKFTLYATLLAPLAVWGLLTNVLPYLLTSLAARRAPDEPMRAVTGLLTGAVLYPASYAAQGWALHALTGSAWWWVLLYVVSLPPAGFFWLRYWRQLARYRKRILVRTLFLTDRALVVSLAAERQRLLSMFDQLRERFVREAGSKMDEHLAAKVGK
jgi:1-acyl-sn-glycerol-3-phosphate acyltransferase